eukprot:CAMPEP_0172571892 /NCGR_PEP_ID=MMETSP1067-20121228/132992_1 /TAXON_ID=265564 ORGANISM="Thalassiosira punctigera, Strain Tpunct2005C2" /NCGR_SAMPLE_ID=MMETSP1067 /ASSEMBLY_ACC=CAM_ASM_000444 /LENGTH=34 /DNA_ID= /DNA_START= /DNA_END= /DNA_ORIENTATION=
MTAPLSAGAAEVFGHRRRWDCWRRLQRRQPRGRL